MITFEQLGLSKQALASLLEVGFSEPTEIQAKTIGIVAQRKDLIASAQTGSGKTAAYVLPVLDQLRAATVDKGTRAKTKVLVIVPTRELALQVKGEFDRFSKDSGLRAVVLYGGTGYRPQVQALHRGADVIVATPGRLLDCVNRGFASLKFVQIAVLDEADRLLDMGFMPQVRAVMDRVPKERQTLMFSATIDNRMRGIADEFLRSPVSVTANQEKIEPSSIEQQFHYVKEAEKDRMLLGLIQQIASGSILVFTRTKRKAAQVTARLRKLEVQAEEIHGDISQNKRVSTLDRFRRSEFNVLVATDVAARGLDIPSISLVVNYDLPMVAEDYVHRIGRTGRAGRSGVAHSFVSADQRHLIRAIQQIMKSRSGQDQSAQDRPVQRISREAIDYADRLNSGQSTPASNSQQRYGKKPFRPARPSGSAGAGRPAGQGRPGGTGRPAGSGRPAEGERSGYSHGPSGNRKGRPNSNSQRRSTQSRYAV